MIINIKGAEYKVIVKDELFDVHEIDNDIPEESYADGYCDVKEKVIYLYNGENNTITHTSLHEITHAYLYECGLIKTCENELLCDFIAGNIMPILKDSKKILGRYSKGEKDGRIK